MIKKLFSPILWGNLLAMAVVGIGLIFGLKLWLDDYTRHGEEIAVPRVTRKASAEAIELLRQSGLDATIADSSYDRSLPAGVILEQRPQAGARVKAGREVRLTVNSGNVPTMALPDILGNSSTREAQDRLRQLGFKLGETQYVSGDRDWVYGMVVDGRSMYNGERAPIGATIILQVGNGYINTLDTLESSFEEDFMLEDEEYTYDYE